MRTLRMMVPALLVGALLVLAAALPASAHEELVGSDPPDGARLAAAPTSVRLEFSADVLTIGAAVVVVDGSGKVWTIGEPVIEDREVSAALAPDMPDAGYEIRWQVVSGDGHPISGVIPFTVGDAAPLSRDPAPNPAGDPLAVQDSPSDSGGIGPWRPVLVGVLGAAGAVALYAVILLLRRRHRDGDSGS